MESGPEINPAAGFFYVFAVKIICFGWPEIRKNFVNL